MIRFSVLLVGLLMVAGCAVPRVEQPRGLHLLEGDPSSSVAVGKVSVHRESKTLSVPGWVNLVEGPIEYLACGPGGKTHESAFVINVDPLDLQSAFLLLGLEPGEPLEDLGQGPPRGTEVKVWVTWEEAGQRVYARAESFARYLPEGAPLPPSTWVFTGSAFEGGQFKALADESLLATYWDPWAILNIQHPCGADDEALVVEPGSTPPYRTPVTFLIEPEGLK